MDKDWQAQFNTIVEAQLQRMAQLSKGEWKDFSKKTPIVIGACGGDGIGPLITDQALRVLAHILKDEIAAGTIILKNIPGLTIENRIQKNQPVPDEVVKDLRTCDVILKGPTTTPSKGDGLPNIESANVQMRQIFDLFACVRPILIPDKNIDWTFIRENTEGEYPLGSQGIQIGDLAIDFKTATRKGVERVIRYAFEFAKSAGKTKVTVVTKSNVVKLTDGWYSEISAQIATEYPGITLDEWFVDIMAAKLIDVQRASEFQVLVMPNLYGDILTDEATQIQGGVGTGGSSNIGYEFAMFEAVHGSGTRMINENRGQFADPRSMIKAASMLLSHIGYHKQSASLDKAIANTPANITGRPGGDTSNEFSDRLMLNLG